MRAAVDAAFVDVDGRRHRVEPASVFDSGRETGHDPGGFDVAPGTTTFWLSFPPVADQAGAGERTSVVLRLAVEGETLEASSPVTLAAADSAPLITAPASRSQAGAGSSVYENEITKSIGQHQRPHAGDAHEDLGPVGSPTAAAPPTSSPAPTLQASSMA